MYTYFSGCPAAVLTGQQELDEHVDGRKETTANQVDQHLDGLTFLSFPLNFWRNQAGLDLACRRLLEKEIVILL